MLEHWRCGRWDVWRRRQSGGGSIAVHGGGSQEGVGGVGIERVCVRDEALAAEGTFFDLAVRILILGC